MQKVENQREPTIQRREPHPALHSEVNWEGHPEKGTHVQE